MKGCGINPFLFARFAPRVIIFSIFRGILFLFFLLLSIICSPRLYRDSTGLPMHVMCDMAHGARRQCIRIMPEKFAKLFTTCVGGAHLRRAATRTLQVLRIIRVAHCVHITVLSARNIPHRCSSRSQTWRCSLLTE